MSKQKELADAIKTLKEHCLSVPSVECKNCPFIKRRVCNLSSEPPCDWNPVWAYKETEEEVKE